MNHSLELKERLIQEFTQTISNINSKPSCEIENNLAKIVQKSRCLIYEDQL